jgi:hypothetical protein
VNREVRDYQFPDHATAEQWLADTDLLGTVSWGTWSCLRETGPDGCECTQPDSQHTISVLVPAPVVLWVGTE